MIEALTAEKKVKGRKRHIVVDTMGNLLAITVHAANIHDTKSGINPAKKAYEKYPTIQKFCGDDGYRKSFEEDVAEQLGLGVDISKRIKPEFEILPLRWRVERTFSWANHSRRLSKDYEIKSLHEENMFIIYDHSFSAPTRYENKVDALCFLCYNLNRRRYTTEHAEVCGGRITLARSFMSCRMLFQASMSGMCDRPTVVISP